MNFILASASPRRQELIQLLGLHWQIMVADVDEESIHHPNPAKDVVQTARLKALAVAKIAPDEAIIVAADTTVDLDGIRLNKPSDINHARQMLNSLRGRKHQVHTGIFVINNNTGQRVADVATIDVPMRDYKDSEIEIYLASGDPLDKAGSYSIQHPEFRPVENLAGCYAGVMGLPLCHLARALGQVGINIGVNIASACQSFIEYRCPVYAEILAE